MSKVTRLDRTVKNWRWWVALVPMLATVAVQFALLLVAVLGELCKQAQEFLERHTFRPLHRWARAGIRVTITEEPTDE